VGGGMLLASVGMVLACGGMRLEGLLPAGGGAGLAWALATLVFFGVQGPAEEIMARGYLMPVIGARRSVAAGVRVSSAVFAGLHLLNPNVAVLPAVNLLLFGIFAALYALREEGLWGVFGVHTAWNWVQGTLLGLPVSGARMYAPPLVHLEAAEPRIWTGGAFGPEGGLVVTIVVLAGIGILLLCRRRTSTPRAGGPTGMA